MSFISFWSVCSIDSSSECQTMQEVPLFNSNQWRNSCHSTIDLVIYSNSTLSHGASNFYFNLSWSRALRPQAAKLFVFIMHKKWKKCRDLHMRSKSISTNLINIMHSQLTFRVSIGIVFMSSGGTFKYCVTTWIS